LLILNEQTRIVVTILIVTETISVLEVTVQNAAVTNQIVTVTIQMVTTTIQVCSFYFKKTALLRQQFHFLRVISNRNN